MTTSLPAFNPPHSAVAQPFWQAIERRALALPRCSECRRWQWYPEPHGTDCSDGELVWEDVATKGTIYTFTTVHRSFLPGTATGGSYVVGSIELDGVDGPKLVANLVDHPTLRIGARVQARFERHGDRLHPVFELTPKDQA